MWASLRGCGGIEYSDDRLMGFWECKGGFIGLVQENSIIC